MAELSDALKTKAAQRAATDEAYRTRLLTDPWAAVNEIAKVPLAAPITIQAVDMNVPNVQRDASKEDVIIVPPFRGVGAELSVDELEAVAGGRALDNRYCGNLNCS